MRMALERRRSLSHTEGEAVGSLISTGTKVWGRERGVFTWGVDWIGRLSFLKRKFM